MSIFGNIMSAIFGKSAQAQPSGTSGQAPSTVPGESPQSAPQQNVDVEAIVSERAKTKKEKLDWRHSIVDLMKVLDLDSSIGARKQPRWRAIGALVGAGPDAAGTRADRLARDARAASR